MQTAISSLINAVRFVGGEDARRAEVRRLLAGKGLDPAFVKLALEKLDPSCGLSTEDALLAASRQIDHDTRLAELATS